MLKKRLKRHKKINKQIKNTQYDLILFSKEYMQHTPEEKLERNISAKHEVLPWLCRIMNDVLNLTYLSFP